MPVLDWEKQRKDMPIGWHKRIQYPIRRMPPGRVDVGDRAQQEGYHFKAVAENIASTSGQNSSVATVMNA